MALTIPKGATSPVSSTTTGVLKSDAGVVSAATPADITGQALTGFTSGPGTITASDTILSAINKLSVNTGDDAANTNYANDYRAANFVAGTDYQAPLVSGTNIKTVGGTSLLGTGDVPMTGGIAYTKFTANTTAVDKQGILADTSGGPFTITLPLTPTVGMQVIIADSGNTWGTNNCTVARNGALIGGLAENLVLNISGASVQLIYDGAGWDVYTQIGASSTGDAITASSTTTFTNKDLTSGTNTFPATLLTASSTSTLTNKTISGANNTLTVDGTTSVGYITVPQNSQSAAYTTVLSDAGKHIFHPSADTTARTFTIPANASVAYPIGTGITFINQNAAGVVTIAITTDTMRLAGAGTVGSRTLAANGIATAIKVTATEWIISGSGLT